MVDWVRVNDLRTEVGEDDYSEIITMFLEETDLVMERLAESNSSAALERDLHFLKGSALNIGLATLANLCQIGEKKAAAGRTDIDIAEIMRVYADSRAALVSSIDGTEAA